MLQPIALITAQCAVTRTECRATRVHACRANASRPRKTVTRAEGGLFGGAWAAPGAGVLRAGAVQCAAQSS